MFVIRARFVKTDECAYISHLDLQRVMSRALRQSGLPVQYSQGFNPHIYMTFALPLSLTHQSVCDAVDFKSEQPPSRDWLAAINACLPKGIELFSIYIAARKPADIGFAQYEISARKDDEALKNAVSQYNDQDTAEVIKKTKRKELTIDLKEHVQAMCVEDSRVTITLPAGDLTLSPTLLTDYLGRFGVEVGDLAVVRTAILDKSKSEWL